MCTPIAAAALAIISTGAQAYGQREQAKAQNKMYAANARSTNESQQIENDMLTARQSQEREAASQALIQNALDAASVRGTSRAAAAESGLSGLSIDALINQTSIEEARNADAIQTNQGWAAEQFQYERQGIAATARSRRNSVSRGSFSPVAAALQIGTSAANAYSGARAAQNRGAGVT